MDTRFRTVVLLVVFFVGAFILRLMGLQLLQPEWANKAESLTSNRYTIPPSRGLILDRHGELMVGSKATHDLTVTPRLLPKPWEDWLPDAARWCGMTQEQLGDALERARRYSSHKASSVRKGLNTAEHAQMASERHRFPGFDFRTRPVRDHLNPTAGHLLGEYAETTADDLSSDPFYQMGDRIGRSGLEKVYELELRGVKGRESVMVDARNQVRNTAATSSDDRPAEAGQDLTLTLDLGLQQFAESLMDGKKGSIVAIEPASGEVLALVSAPDFDPGRLVGPERGEYYRQLVVDPDKPLFNRAIKATYRPGSIWKMVQGLIALDEGRIRPGTRFPCDRELIGCHGPHTQDDLREAVVHSCNPYFYRVMQRVVQAGEGKGRFEQAANGLDHWRERSQAFGFGTSLGARLPGTSTGNIPGSADYDRVYGSRRWDFGTIYSIAIGEGELLTTPLQMANLAAILANRGWYRLPHFVRDLGGNGKPSGLGIRQETGVDPRHFNPVVEAMRDVVDQPSGTGRRARIDGIAVCGKTGTVQDEPRKDHSVFIAFAPMYDPQIALSVYVENSGFGGEWAAPIAALLIEQYLTGEVASVARLNRILDADLSDPYPEPEEESAEETATDVPMTELPVTDAQ